MKVGEGLVRLWGGQDKAILHSCLQEQVIVYVSKYIIIKMYLWKIAIADIGAVEY